MYRSVLEQEPSTVIANRPVSLTTPEILALIIIPADLQIGVQFALGTLTCCRDCQEMSMSHIINFLEFVIPVLEKKLDGKLDENKVVWQMNRKIALDLANLLADEEKYRGGNARWLIDAYKSILVKLKESSEQI